MREPLWSLPDLLTAVAGELAELGGGWSPVPEEDRGHRRIQKGDVVLHFSQTSYGSAAEVGRVTVSGSYWHLSQGVNGGYRSPRDYGAIKYEEKEPSIGVAVSRGAAVVAKEIRRRLLPEVERITAAMKVKVAEALAHQDQTLTNAERFAEALGGEVRANDGGRYGGSREIPVYANGNGSYVSARVCGDSVRFEHFTTDIETALAIGRAIRQREAAP